MDAGSLEDLGALSMRRRPGRATEPEGPGGERPAIGKRPRGATASSVAFAMAYAETAFVVDRFGRFLPIRGILISKTSRRLLEIAVASTTVPGLIAWIATLGLLLWAWSKLRVPDIAKTITALVAFGLFTAALAHFVYSPMKALETRQGPSRPVDIRSHP